MKKLTNLTLLVFLALGALAQAPQGFSYQAVIRNAEGQPLVEQDVSIRLTLQSEAGDEVYYTETHTLPTSPHGVVSVAVGSGSGITGSLTDIPWSAGGIHLKVEVDPAGGTAYGPLGTSLLLAVPYALYAHSATHIVADPSAGEDEPLFVVRNSKDEIVFAVYESGVRVYVDDSSKSSRGGFAVGGLSDQNKAKEGIHYLKVTPDSVRVNIKTPAAGEKSSRGGFAVGGLSDQNKEWVSRNLLFIAPDSARIYIEADPSKQTRGGFAVGGLSDQNKGNSDLFFNISPDGDEIINPSEPRIVWYPLKNAFLAGQVIIESPDSVGTNSWASGFESKAIGDYSQALGYESVARGSFSTAIGRHAIAGGHNSFAFGNNSLAGWLSEHGGANNAYAFGQGSVATGNGSYAIGFEAEASGQDAFAIGRGTEASGKGSFAIGFIGQDSLGNVTDRTRATQDWAVAIGMGAKATGRGAFALGSMTEASGGYSLATGHRTIASGYYASAFGQDTEAEGWVSSAFGWETLASGNLSFATGHGSQASGWASVALGQGVLATENASIALGYRTESHGWASVALGAETKAEKDGATAGGLYSTAGGRGSTAFGLFARAFGEGSAALGNALASADGSSAMGKAAEAYGENSIALGHFARTYGESSFATGFESAAQGDHSVAMGHRSYAVANKAFALGSVPATSYNSFVIGRFPYVSWAYNVNEWIPEEPLFIIGNGHGDWDSDPTTAFKNAFTVLKNGMTAINHHDPTEMLDVNGNARYRQVGSSDQGNLPLYITNEGVLSTAASDLKLKTNISTLTNALSTIVALRGVHFSWLKDANALQKVGFIAQEVEEVLPEVVFTNPNDGYMGVNYAEITAVLVEAVKEQQQLIEELQEKNKELESLKAEIEAIKALIGK